MKVTKKYEPGLIQEARVFDFDKLEIRTSGENEPKKIVGHAAVFGKLSEDLGGFRETFEPGSFVDTIKKDDIRSLFNHMPSYILGRNKAGTLLIEEDEKGAYYEVTPPDTRYSRDLMVSIERGDVSQCSIIFVVDGKAGERWLVDGAEVKAMDAFMAMWDGKKHSIERHILKARLFDVGPVTFPAYPQTSVKVRDYLAATNESEEILGDQGPTPTGKADESLEIYKRKIDIAAIN